MGADSIRHQKLTDVANGGLKAGRYKVAPILAAQQSGVVPQKSNDAKRRLGDGFELSLVPGVEPSLTLILRDISDRYTARKLA